MWEYCEELYTNHFYKIDEMKRVFKNINHQYLYKMKKKTWIIGTGNFTLIGIFESYQRFKELFKKIEEEMIYFLTWSMVPVKL